MGKPYTHPVGFPNDLTEREMEVLLLVALGLSDVQVADLLVISPRTVKAHLRSIYSKLEVTSRHAATRFAFEMTKSSPKGGCRGLVEFSTISNGCTPVLIHSLAPSGKLYLKLKQRLSHEQVHISDS